MDLPEPEPDLERIAGDLADIDQALDRLNDGSYWTDEITGETIPDAVLAADPTARRAASHPAAKTADEPVDDRGHCVDNPDPPPGA